jgi:hypothetical protein
MKKCLLALALLAACAPTQRKAPVTTTPNGQRLRLGWITWSDVNELIFCTRRIDDDANQVGNLGPCWRQAAGDQPKKMFAWLNAGRPDDTPPDRGPWDRCLAEIKDTTVVLATPTERTVLDEWKPGNDVQGDRFAVELSFSPEGKWMAVEHVAIHVGEGERIIEIPSVEIRPVPACR